MREIPIAATGILRSFCESGWLRPIDFHLARRVGGLAGEADPEVLLAFALAARELRLGSVCVDLATAATHLQPEVDGDAGVSTDAEAPPWPESTTWLASVSASRAVAGPDSADGRPFRLDGSLLYLDRYWRQESRLATILRQRSARPALDAQTTIPAQEGQTSDPTQDDAVLAALNHATVVITGGPGTGKTTIVARILSALAEASPRVALVAPTGKAAARLQSAVAGRVPPGLVMQGSTIHKLLGARPRSSRFEFGAHNLLPYDVVVVDETSMVSLELMTALVDAVSPDTRLILLGDPHQLRSVEAGAVLADIEQASDLVTGPGGAIVRLRTNFRSHPEINLVADAILAGDATETLRLINESGALSFVEFNGTEDPAAFQSLRHDALSTARAVRSLALDGLGDEANRSLGRHRVLCGHREGPFGVTHWGRSVRAWLATQLEGYGFDAAPYPGQPLLIQRNTDLFSNGDTAVVVRRPSDDALMAVVDVAEKPLWVAPSLLDDAADLHAMTIHKSQGSQFTHVSVVLPPQGSPLLTRELVYTAVTRAEESVTFYGSVDALTEAVSTPARRASGLARDSVQRT